MLALLAAPLLPYPTTKASHGMQFFIAGHSTRSMVLPGLTIFACRNNGVCTASSDGIMAGLGVVRAVTTDTGDGLRAWMKLCRIRCEDVDSVEPRCGQIYWVDVGMADSRDWSGKLSKQ